MPRIIPFYHTAVFPLTGIKGQRHISSFRLSTDAPSTVEAITYFCDVFSGGFPFTPDVSVKFQESTLDLAGGEQTTTSGDPLIQLLEIASRELGGEGDEASTIGQIDLAIKASEEAKLRINQAISAINSGDLGTARDRIGDPAVPRPRGNEGPDAIGRAVAAVRATDTAEEHLTKALDGSGAEPGGFRAALVLANARTNRKLADLITLAINTLAVRAPDVSRTGRAPAQEALQSAEICLLASPFEGPREKASLWGFALWNSDLNLAARFGGSVNDPVTDLGEGAITIQGGAVRRLIDAFNALGTHAPGLPTVPQTPNPTLATTELNRAVTDIDTCFARAIAEAREQTVKVVVQFDFGCSGQRDPLIESLGGIYSFESIRFFFSLFDENSGRELQNEKIHCMSGLGGSATTRPRRLSRPLVMPRGTVVRVEIEEIFSLLTLGLVRQDLNVDPNELLLKQARTTPRAAGEQSESPPATTGSSTKSEDPDGFLKVTLHFTLHGYRTFPS